MTTRHSNRSCIIQAATILAVFVLSFLLLCGTKSVYAEDYEPSDLIYVDAKNTEQLLTDIDGNTVSTLADGKPKILFFFNTTCPRCKAVEETIKAHGLNTDEVDFVMAESSNGGVSEEVARKFFDDLGIDATSKCYDARDICWYYLRRCGYTDDSTKKPIIIYITEDNIIGGYTWNYTNIYKAAQAFGIKLETGDHQWEDYYGTYPETGAVKACSRCAVCEIETTRTIDIPVPAKNSFVYNGKSQYVLKNIPGYTVTNGCKKATGEYEAVITLKDTTGCQWSDGTTEPKTISWSITRGKQKPVISTGSKKYKRSTLRKKAKSFTLKVTGCEGKKTFTKTGGSTRLKLDKKTGKVTVKKGTRKGKYRIKVKVTAAATSNCYAGTSAVKTITVKVK